MALGPPENINPTRRTALRKILTSALGAKAAIAGLTNSSSDALAEVWGAPFAKIDKNPSTGNYKTIIEGKSVVFSAEVGEKFANPNAHSTSRLKDDEIMFVNNLDKWQRGAIGLTWKVRGDPDWLEVLRFDPIAIRHRLAGKRQAPFILLMRIAVVPAWAIRSRSVLPVRRSRAALSRR